MSSIAVLQELKKGAMGCAAGIGITRKWNINKLNPIAAGQIPLGNNVNGFTVKNRGTTLVLVNREPLNPGESQTIGGNEGEIYVGRLDISFQVPVPAPPTITNSAWVTIKYYVQ